MSDPTRGITCSDMRRVVREALRGGWEWVRWTGTTHAEIRWPATGDVLRFGSTPSVASWKSLATDIRRISGVQVWRKGNRKRSRKSTRAQVDPQVEASRRRHRKAIEARARERAAIDVRRQQQALAASRAADDDRRRREIESLMRPGG